MGDLRVQPETNIGADFSDTYKETEIGLLPEEWKVVQIRDVAKVITGKTPSTKEPQYWEGSIPFITPVDLQGTSVEITDRTITEEGLKASKSLPSGTVMVSCIGYIGKVGVTEAPVSVTNQQINSVLPDEDIVSNWYLAYIFMHLESHLKDRAAITTVPILNKSNFELFELPFPSLPEQKAIAHILRTVQKAIETTEQVIESTRELKRSLMNHLFTYGPVPVDEAEQVSLKETEIGSVPEHWDLVQVADVFEWQLGKMLSPAAKKGISPRPYLRNLNVQWGRVDVRDLVEMDFTEKERDKFGLKKGDILICEGGEVGRTAIWRDEIPECYFQKAIHRLRPKDGRVQPEFFLYHMMNAFLLRRSYGVVGTDTTIAHLPGIKLKALKIPLPPKNEQEEISRLLEGVDNKIQIESDHKQSLAVLFKALLHNLMTGRVRVKDLDLSEVAEMV